MAERTKKATAQRQPSARNHYGRVYHFHETPTPRYSARIWDQDGRDIWHTTEDTPEQAFAKMREHARTMSEPARTMSEPVDLWRHGNEFVETVNTDLPF